MTFTYINRLCQLLAERFNIPVPFLPVGIGKEILNQKTQCVSLIIGQCWSNEDKDWRYLVTDVDFITAPLWVSAKQMRDEMLTCPYCIDSNICNKCSGGGFIQEDGELVCCPRCNGTGSV